MATQRSHQYVKEAIEAITRRAELIAGVEAAEEVRQELKRKMDLWQKRAQRTAQGSQLGYETKKDGVTIGLLRKPSIEPWDEFTCLNSLRDVEPTANLILDDYNLDDEGDDERRRRSRHHEQQGRKTLQGRRTAAQPGAHHVRHRFDHRPAEPVGHGHGPGGLAAQGHRGDRRAAAPGFGEGSAGPAGEGLRSAPVVPDTDQVNQFEPQSLVGIPVAPFPRWMVCPLLSAAGPA